MQRVDYVERYIFADQDLRFQRRTEDRKRTKKAQKRKVNFDYKNPYVPIHFHKQLEKIHSFDGKWDYLGTTRLDEGRYDALSSYSLAVSILCKQTNDRRSIAKKARVPWAEDTNLVLTNMNNTLERLLQASETLGWKSEILLRQSVWASIFFCTALGSLETQIDDAWTPYEPNIVGMCFAPKVPVAKYTVHELWMTIMAVKKEWSHIRITDEVIEFLDRLRVRAAITCSLVFSPETGVHDVESFRMLFKDGEISMHRSNITYLNFLLFFFSDVDRVLSFRYDFLYQKAAVAPEGDNSLGKKRREKFSKWLEGGIAGEHHMPIVRQFKDGFILTLLRPGDVETYREDSKADVIKGAKMRTYANPRPLQVFTEINKTEVDVIQSKWYTNLHSLPQTRLDIPLHREARDFLDKLVFRATLSAHTDIDFSDYYHEFCFSDLEPDEGDTSPREWQVMRMMGDFYIYRILPKRKVFLVHTMVGAIFVWMNEFIKQRTKELKTKKFKNEIEVQLAEMTVDLMQNLRSQMFDDGSYRREPTETKTNLYEEYMGNSKDIVPMEQ